MNLAAVAVADVEEWIAGNAACNTSHPYRVVFDNTNCSDWYVHDNHSARDDPILANDSMMILMEKLDVEAAARDVWAMKEKPRWQLCLEESVMEGSAKSPFLVDHMRWGMVIADRNSDATGQLK